METSNLQLTVTAPWYKIQNAGEKSYALGQPKQRKFKFDSMSRFALDVPGRILLSSLADSVPCDRYGSITGTTGPDEAKISYRPVSLIGLWIAETCTQYLNKCEN